MRIIDLKIDTKHLLGAIIGICLLAVIGCADEDDPITSTPPVLSYTPVNIEGPYNASDSTFGDIFFKAESPVMRPFGHLIALSTYTRQIEYYTTMDAPVIACVNGIVDEVIENPFIEGDYEIRVVFIPGSDYTVIYDHVNDVLIQEDLAITAGDTLGTAGNFSDNVSKVSLSIITGTGSDERWYCPLTFGDDEFVQAHETLVDAYNDRGRTPRYDSLCVLQVLGPR